ncbi:glycerol-3-phosphate dehydrogenase (NAD(P)+) [Litorimonas taeanensis]|uniref:Glycerol-3-phosphate dehydrogenase [NAD(P)+] n=1 Tax=Litorimonas taeanensis TaxID=568099 RepID=A0A420WID9_9PROT|nr:NAD(P)H-dependent glycerol-3-phosphate dehydrogenase [Litorimonas taeanensis]RKQ70794.1 glycerol-3-phosphate dehydrogenase (NAD(P)+) [Litorimonas taeanensis]
MTQSYQSFGVIGAGAWGTALAQNLAVAGRDVTLWAFEKDTVDSINKAHENTAFLPGIALSPSITATQDLTALVQCDALLSVAPAQHTRSILSTLSNEKALTGKPVILCSKGIEISTREFMSDVLSETLPQVVPVVLSGPSFAIDVAKGLPTAVTLACKDEVMGAALVQAVAAPTFRPYLATDVLGAEIGGAVKNVLAIACGMVLGMGLGRSAHAAIIARGFAEMRRLGKKLGCDPETLTGLCGLGDLVLTCSSEQSRNMSCGFALGKGESLEKILAARTSVTEGVASAPALKKMAESLDVDMPISIAVADILAGDLNIQSALVELLAREHKTEVL